MNEWMICLNPLPLLRNFRQVLSTCINLFYRGRSVRWNWKGIESIEVLSARLKVLHKVLEYDSEYLAWMSLLEFQPSGSTGTPWESYSSSYRPPWTVHHRTSKESCQWTFRHPSCTSCCGSSRWTASEQLIAQAWWTCSGGQRTSGEANRCCSPASIAGILIPSRFLLRYNPVCREHKVGQAYMFDYCTPLKA